jgi:hypothetical protein
MALLKGTLDILVVKAFCWGDALRSDLERAGTVGTVASRFCAKGFSAY